MSDARRKALEEYAKSVEEGLPFSEDFIGKTRDVENNALLARNLAEDTLGQQVLKNTGIPIPGKEASRLKQEDFLHRIMKERYPELEPNIQMLDLSKEGAHASYDPSKKLIELEQTLPQKRGIESTTGKLLHEAGHQFDDQMLNKVGKNLDMATLRKMQAKGMDLKQLDPTTVYEMYAQSHHANIPNLREGTFGLGALKNYLKKGTFRAIAPVGIGAALTAASGDASASDFIPGLDQAADIGESRDEEAQMLGEAQGAKDYNKSQARRDALQALKRPRR